MLFSNKNKVRYADIYKEATRPFTNHPVCAAKEGDLFINGAATPPWKGACPSNWDLWRPVRRVECGHGKNVSRMEPRTELDVSTNANGLGG